VAAPPEPRKPAPPPVAASAPPKADASQETLFWESVRASNNAAELQAYLDKYPQGTFAPLARARLDALAAAQAKAAAEPKLNVPPRAGAAQETLRVPAGADVAAKAASARSYAGRWTGQIACDAFEGAGPFTGGVRVEVQNDAFVVERGQRDQPGWWQVRGVPDANGRLQLAGSGISGHPNYQGKPYAASVAGKLEGDRYQGAGRFGSRACTLSMARAAS
jgi:hypothetical protein